jgi:threonine synthase
MPYHITIVSYHHAINLQYNLSDCNKNAVELANENLLSWQLADSYNIFYIYGVKARLFYYKRPLTLEPI